MVPFLIFVGLLGVAFVVIWFLTPTTPRRHALVCGDSEPGPSTWPWLLVTVAGTVLLLFAPTIFTAPSSPIRRSPLNLYMGGLSLSMIVAIGALASQTARRWPALFIMTGLVPLLLLVVDPPEHDEPWFERKSDKLLVSMLPAMFLISGYALVRPTPRRPPAQAPPEADSKRPS